MIPKGLVHFSLAMFEYYYVRTEGEVRYGWTNLYDALYLSNWDAGTGKLGVYEPDKLVLPLGVL